MSTTEKELEKKKKRIDAWEKLHMPTRITQTVRVMNPKFFEGETVVID